MLHRNKLIAGLFGLALAAAAGTAGAADQFVPLLSYRVGAYAAGGSGIFGSGRPSVSHSQVRYPRQDRNGWRISVSMLS